MGDHCRWFQNGNNVLLWASFMRTYQSPLVSLPFHLLLKGADSCWDADLLFSPGGTWILMAGCEIQEALTLYKNNFAAWGSGESLKGPRQLLWKLAPRTEGPAGHLYLARLESRDSYPPCVSGKPAPQISKQQYCHCFWGAVLLPAFSVLFCVFLRILYRIEEAEKAPGKINKGGALLPWSGV